MKKQTYYLIGSFVVLLLIAYLVMQKPGESSKELNDEELFLKIDSAAINKFVIKSQFGEIIVEKQGLDWYMTKPVRYPADTFRIKAGITRLKNMVMKSLTSTNKAKQSVYGVDDSSGTSVKIYQNGKETVHLYIGKPGTAPIQTFVRKANSNDVYSVTGSLSYMFNAPDKDWRNKQIVAINENDLKEIKFGGNESFTLERSDTIWTINGQPANKSEVNGMMQTLSSLNTDFFLDSLVEDMPEISTIMTLGNVQLRIAQVDDERYYVQTSQSPQWFIVLKGKIKRILKTKADFLKKEEES
jgi:hypothetical protein